MPPACRTSRGRHRLYVRFNDHQQHLEPRKMRPDDQPTSHPRRGCRRHRPFEGPVMNTKHKTQQWAPTELPRMRRELVLAAEEAADRVVNDPKVATRLQADEEKFADHVAKTDPAMAQRLRSQVHYRLRLRRSPRTGRWPFSPTCRARRSGSAGSRTARTSGPPPTSPPTAASSRASWPGRSASSAATPPPTPRPVKVRIIWPRFGRRIWPFSTPMTTYRWIAASTDVTCEL